MPGIKDGKFIQLREKCICKSFATGHCSKVIFRQLNATTHYFFHVFFAKCRYVSRRGNEKEEKEQMFVGI